MENIKEICSHEQALGQCSRFLSANPGIKVTVVENTAAAAKMVSDSGRTDLAAIASDECAQLYNLTVLSNEIQNTANNYTRNGCNYHNRRAPPKKQFHFCTCMHLDCSHHPHLGIRFCLPD